MSTLVEKSPECGSVVLGGSNDDCGSHHTDLDVEVTTLLVLESVMRYYVQATGKLDEQQVRKLLKDAFPGTSLMDTFINGYIAQGEQRGCATMLLRQIERKFGPPSEPIRTRITEADSKTLLEWSDRILVAGSLEEVLH